MSETLKGVVKWFNDAKGFGFIEHTSGKDVFVHYSVIEVDGFKTLKDGEEVEYEMKEGPKGLQAVKVQRSGPPAGSVEASAESGAEAPDNSLATESADSDDSEEDAELDS
jgi:CspA family cold shock protein